MNKIQFIAQTKSHTTREMNSMIVTLGPSLRRKKGLLVYPKRNPIIAADRNN